MKVSKKSTMRLKKFYEKPVELYCKCGEWFRIARENLGFNRDEIASGSGIDYTDLVKFEMGGLELTDGLWKAYTETLDDNVSMREFGPLQAKMLMRGLINEIRLYGRN